MTKKMALEEYLAQGYNNCVMGGQHFKSSSLILESPAAFDSISYNNLVTTLHLHKICLNRYICLICI